MKNNMWAFYLLCVIVAFAFILIATYCFLVITSSEKKYKQSSFDKKLLEHCKVHSNSNDIESEENK